METVRFLQAQSRLAPGAAWDATGFARHFEDFGDLYEQCHHVFAQRVRVSDDRLWIDLLLSIFSFEGSSIGQRNALQIFTFDNSSNGIDGSTH